MEIPEILIYHQFLQMLSMLREVVKLSLCNSRLYTCAHTLRNGVAARLQILNVKRIPIKDVLFIDQQAKFLL